MSFFSRLFGFGDDASADEIADLRSALGPLIKRCLRDQSQGYDLKVWGCVLNGVPIGNWRFTVERISDDEKELGT